MADSTQHEDLSNHRSLFKLQGPSSGSSEFSIMEGVPATAPRPPPTQPAVQGSQWGWTPLTPGPLMGQRV